MPLTVASSRRQAVLSHQDIPSPVNSAVFPGDTPLGDDGFSDPAIYDVMEYVRPQQELEPAHYPFLEETDNWMNFDLLVCTFDYEMGVDVYNNVSTGRTLERQPGVVALRAVACDVVA